MRDPYTPPQTKYPTPETAAAPAGSPTSTGVAGSSGERSGLREDDPSDDGDSEEDREELDRRRRHPRPRPSPPRP